MFTGIVEEIGKVVRWQRSTQVCKLTIQCKKVLEDTNLGDSIAVNGVCLTVADLTPDSFTADIMVESLRKTSLADLPINGSVNLERALQVGGRLGGHWVTGHIDGVGVIKEIVPEANSIWYTIELPPSLEKYMVDKGSIAVDGVSLTIAKAESNMVTLSLIPHTAKITILGSKGVGDKVNIEADILGKYVYKMLMDRNEERKTQSEIDLNKLQQLGFI
ncbi:MAG: riboflavin synthase [Firmicutes bacterium]|nr:riboflavin synthase [Bacillota bacterium]